MDSIYEPTGDTWPKVLKHNHDVYGNRRRAIRHKCLGIWQPVTWQDYFTEVKYLALGLLASGFEPRDKALIVGDNAPQWYYAQLAVQSLHGISVGAYSDLPAEEIRHIARDAEIRWAIVEDQEQVDKLLAIKDQLPGLQKIIHWTYKGLAGYKDGDLIGYRLIVQMGREYAQTHGGSFEQHVAAGRPDDVCAIVYTPAATRELPQGAVHTYATLMASARACLNLDPWRADDNYLPYLPPSWIAEQWFGIGCHLLAACTLNLAESAATQPRDSREAGPSIFINRARWWETQAARVQARISASGRFKRLVFKTFMPVGYRWVDLKSARKRPWTGSRIMYRFSGVILFTPLKKSLGLHNARICYSTGAAINPDVLRFFHALNLPLKSVYGSTEGGVLTGAANEDIRFDTIGPPLDAVQTKIGDKGQMIFRHPGVFIGYHQDKAKTDEVLREGWFFSDDRGFVAENKHLVFVDRANDTIDLAGGAVLAPQMIESRLRYSPCIKDAWVSARSGQAWAIAVIVINYEYVSHWAGQRKIQFATFADLAQHPAVYELVKSEIAGLNRHLPAGGRIGKFVNFHKEFSPDDGELARNLALRRFLLTERCQQVTDAAYGGLTQVPVETNARSGDGKIARTTIQLTIASLEGTAP